MQKPPDFAWGYCRAEQVTLHFLAAERAQQFMLLRRLDALCDRNHVACCGDIHHSLHNAGGPVRLRQVVDEAAVDLDLVEWKALQIVSEE
jgi:hypothetical protein